MSWEGVAETTDQSYWKSLMFVSSVSLPRCSLLAEVRSLWIWLRRWWGDDVLCGGSLVFGSALRWCGALWWGATDGELLLVVAYWGAQHLFAVLVDLSWDVSPAEIATEHAVQRCFVVYIHASVTVVFEELGELVGYVTILFKLSVELLERVLGT